MDNANKRTTEALRHLFFSLEQSNVEYVVLRNWEGFYEDLLVKGHNDIDVLCKTEKDKQLFIALFKAKSICDPYYGKYEFDVASEKFFLDFRIVGDGYYCKKWEIQMLKTRILDEKGFYRLDNTIYYYALLYHGLIHKNKIDCNYLVTLKRIRSSASERDYEHDLISYMRHNGYYYSLSYDKFVGQFFKGETIKRKEEISTKIISFKIRIKKWLERHYT